jgi:hypothetical protein
VRPIAAFNYCSEIERDSSGDISTANLTNS